MTTKKTTTIPTTIPTMTETRQLSRHAAALDLYVDISRLASCRPSGQLADDQIDAYLLLPELISDCRDAWEQIPESLRSNHYLLPCI